MIKLALPGGSLRGEVAASLLKAGLPVEEYSQGSRSYRFQERGLLFRVFREPDIPIQVALGNYDLGLCRPAWVEELLWRYPGHEVVRLGSLGIGGEGLFVAAAPQSPLADGGLEALAGYLGLRIASEYPNLADAFALSARLPAYCIFPVWGAAEVYPPEDADLALVAAADEAGVEALGLVPLLRLFSGSCCLIAHRHSLREKDLGALLGTLLRIGSGYDGDGLTPPGPLPRQPGPLKSLPIDREEGLVRLALPDGHQQPHAMAALESAGLAPAGYGADGPRRLSGPLPYLQAKVIRPQDMPQHVALGSFDLAITGRDWLLEHLYQFPQSPAVEAADLGRGRYRLAAVASEEIP
ncbi:MAG TPA: ATP phosphoribosyltransferase, partial [Dehalococcoidia bacterium]|nr:ATP phosphoribosyltransferase [Dehalococcoidia bacterium]